MLNWLYTQALARPDGPAVYYDGACVTYRELHTQVAHAVQALQALGVGAGSGVAVLMGNRLTTIVAIHALMRLGATLVMLNTRLTVDELAHQMQVAVCQVLLYDEANLSNAMALSLRQTDLKPIVAEQFGGAPNRNIAKSDAGRDIDLTAPAVIMFTSGSTGKPKGVVLTWENFWHSAMTSAYRLGVLPKDRWLCVLPLYHVGGLSIVLRSCLYGTAIDLHPKFDAYIIHQALLTQPVTLISLVPTMLSRLLDSGATGEIYSHVRLVLLGGAAATPELMARATAAAIPVATTYGLTEATSQVATALPVDVQRKPGSVGKALVFTELRVVDETRCDMPTAEIGEVIVRGPTIMRGYLNDMTATAHAIQDGWLHTGDLGYLDSAGDLYLVQRRSDLIVSGGENVYPAEVEAILRKHPAVQDVAVVGVSSAEWGQQVAALIVPTPNATLTAEALSVFCRQSLAGYKVPRLFRFRAALPQTASGKVDRVEVTRMLGG